MHLVLLAALLFSFAPATFQQRPLESVQLSSELLKKIVPVPTVPPEISRSHRVGSQRYRQFGKRCWHTESCNECVCCGRCLEGSFTCDSPPGSVDYCLFYEKIAAHTDIEKVNETVSYKLPDDFPVMKME